MRIASFSANAQVTGVCGFFCNNPGQKVYLNGADFFDYRASNANQGVFGLLKPEETIYSSGSVGINEKLYVKKCRMEQKFQKDILTEDIYHTSRRLNVLLLVIVTIG